MAASVLNQGVTKLYNVPDIHDTKIMLEILEHLGCKIKKNRAKIVIDSSNVNTYEMPENLMREMRASVILAGSLLGRYKKATFLCPGGCDIGGRPIDLHLKGFEQLGVHIEEDAGFIRCNCDKLIGKEIHLDFPSVGATENIILASILAEGTTTIENAAMEPEIVDLQKFLNKMGAKITGAGSPLIKIEGVVNLKKEVSYNIMPDRIECRNTSLCSSCNWTVRPR